MNQVVKGALAQQRQAETAIAEYQSDGQVIARAMATESVDQLPAKLRDRAEREATARVEKPIAEGVADGSIADEQVLGLVNSAMEDNAVQSGTVTRDVQAISTLAMRNMVGPDGLPTEAAIETVLKYGRLLDGSAKAANSMFTTPASINTMAAVFEAASGNLTSPQLVGDAIAAAHADRTMTFGTGPVRDQPDQDRIASDVADNIDKWLKGEDIGILQAIAPRSAATLDTALQQTNVEQDIMNSQETRDTLEGAVLVETNRLLQEDPSLSPNIAVQRATAQVTDRTAVIGGTPHVMEPGFEMTTQMFGELASTYDKPGIASEALTNYLAGLVASGELPAELGEVSPWEASIFGGIGDISTAWTGKEPRQFGTLDAMAVERRGLRPYIFRSDGRDGNEVMFLMPDGSYIALDRHVDMRAVGAEHIRITNEALSK